MQRVLGVETVLLRSDTGEQIAADPLKIQLPEAPTASKPQIPPIDEPHYSDADWAAVTRRRPQP